MLVGNPSTVECTDCVSGQDPLGKPVADPSTTTSADLCVWDNCIDAEASDRHTCLTCDQGYFIHYDTTKCYSSGNCPSLSTEIDAVASQPAWGPAMCAPECASTEYNQLDSPAKTCQPCSTITYCDTCHQDLDLTVLCDSCNDRPVQAFDKKGRPLDTENDEPLMVDKL